MRLVEKAQNDKRELERAIEHNEELFYKKRREIRNLRLPKNH